MAWNRNQRSSIIQNDRRHVWHPFTQSMTEIDPVIITRAKGASLYDDEGREILDLISSWWTCTHGHSHPEINAALSSQAETLEHVMFAGFTHPKAVSLATQLSGILAEDLNRVFYSDNGSTAVEVALKIAYQFWRNKGDKERSLFLAMEGGYHGDTLGAMSVGRGSGFFSLYEDLMCEVQPIPFSANWDGRLDIDETENIAIRELEKVLEQKQNKIAAIIMEPLLQGAGGMKICRPVFVDRICSLVREASIPVIFDEIATGFGRTGTMFAYEQTNTVPDIICLSKGLTAGYMPLSVTVVRDQIYDQFLGPDFSTALAHGHSFTANPLATAVAVRSLELFQEENTLDRITQIEERHCRFLEQLQMRRSVHHCRYLGSILAADLTMGSDYKSPISVFLRDWYLEYGFNIRPIGATLYLMPPYCIDEKQLDLAYEVLLEGLILAEKKYL